MTTGLPPLIVYPATLPLVILRNSTFRKRFVVNIGGTPIDLTIANTIIDADIKDVSGTEIGTFTAVLPEVASVPVPGTFDLELSPSESLALPLGTDHKWDVSITFPSGDRFYYCKGPLEVCDTQSRNS